MKSLFPRLNRIVLCFKLGLRLIWQSGSSWTIANATLLFVQGILPLISLFLMKQVVDSISTGIANSGTSDVFEQVGLLISLIGVVIILTNICSSLSGIVSQAQSQLVTDRVHDIIHAKAIELDLEYYEDSQYYDMLYRAQQQASSQPTNILNGLVQFAQSSVSLLGMSGLLLSFHWLFVVILFITSVPHVIARLRYASIMYNWKTQRTILERQAWYFHWMLTGNIHSKEIRLLDLGSVFRKRFRTLRKKLRQENLQITTRRSVVELIAKTSTTIFVYGAYAFIARQAVKGNITLGDLIIYQQAFQRGQSYLEKMLGSLSGLYENSLFLSNLYQFFDLKPKIIDLPHPYFVPQPMKTGIMFNNVSFCYPKSSRQALENVTLTIEPGKVVALVGENGAGKTTLVKLLCRLYDPTKGSITVDGIDLRQLLTVDLRRQISVVFQDYGQYNLSAQDNIWFGDTSLPYEHEKIVEAASDAGIAEVIGKLPYAYNTILGKWVEGGEELSIGQWQKIALARAFIRDAQIIILDEPTSSLDAKAEAEVFKKFHQLIKGKTAILISHRLSTVKMADRIYVMDKGSITESGTHEELMQLDGTYAYLFETQAQNYQ